MRKRLRAVLPLLGYKSTSFSTLEVNMYEFIVFSSPVNFACCTARCQKASNRTECRRALDDDSDCLGTSYCKYPFFYKREEFKQRTRRYM